MYTNPDFLTQVDNAIRFDLQSWRDLFFHWLVWSSVVVAVGVALEGPEVVHEVRNIRRFPKLDTKDWIKLVGMLGWVLVVLGVAGEGVFELSASVWDDKIKSFDEILITEAQRNAISAESGTIGLEIELTGQKARVAEANRIAESERLARVKIEASVQWRRLTEKQKFDIGKDLSRFSNQGVSFWSQAGDAEAELFAADIADAVSHAKTLRIYAPAQMMTMLEGGPGNLGKPIVRVPTGVVVQHSDNPQSVSLAKAIADNLNSVGFDAVLQSHTMRPEESTMQAWVVIEARPFGPQGEYKLQAEHDAKKKN